MLEMMMKELESLATPKMKQYYLSQGAKEPLYGVPTTALKPIAKKYKNNQDLAEALYETRNYDCMYLAGMIANVKLMIPEDFERWIERAYFYMISDFIVAVTLAETDFAQEIALKFINGGVDLKMSAGWSTFEWLLGYKKDEFFDKNLLQNLLHKIEVEIETAPENTRNAMRRFVIAVGVSYVPLHEQALETAEKITPFLLQTGNKRAANNPLEAIRQQKKKGRIGFKRRSVRC